MAEHVDQPVDIPTTHFPLCTSADNAGISYSSIGNLNSLAHIVNTTENSYRLGSQTHVSVP
jgi:hypothetical protein